MNIDIETNITDVRKIKNKALSVFSQEATAEDAVLVRCFCCRPPLPLLVTTLPLAVATSLKAMPENNVQIIQMTKYLFLSLSRLQDF